MIATYQFEAEGLNAEIRVAGTAEAPLFVAADVCAVLEIKNTTQALETLDGDERSMVSIGRQGEANCVTESGLYHLIFKSRKPAAKAFRRWVTEEVLPAIRQTGGYQLAKMPAEEDRLSLPRWLVDELGLNLALGFYRKDFPSLQRQAGVETLNAPASAGGAASPATAGGD